jgi:3-oxoacyl-[acyl-carrier-protein] synthase II
MPGDTTGRDTLARDIAVTGLGLLTAAGVGVAANWATVTAGRPAASTDPALAGLAVDFDCRVGGFDADRVIGRRRAWRMDRYTHLAVAAAREAVVDAGLDPSAWDSARVGVVLGSALGGNASYERQHQTLLSDGGQSVSPMLIPMMGVNMVAGEVAIDLGARGPNLVTTTACASGTTAIGTARDLLRAGACDVVITGAAESCLTPTIIAAFSRMGALSGRGTHPSAASRPFDVDRDGFVAGEGAAVLVLERLADARARGATVRARLAGYGASGDAFHMTSPDPQGRGAELAIRAALADAGVGPSDVDHVNAHGTSTPINDVTEARLLSRVLGARPAVTSTKGVTGHALGAAGAIETAFTVLSIQHELVPPTANLDSVDPEIDIDLVRTAARSMPIEVAMNNSFGFGGQNAVLVLTRA